MFDLVPLRECAAKVADAQVVLASDDELLNAARELEFVRRSVDAAQAAVLSELHLRGTTDLVSGHRTPQWLSAHTGVARGDAARRVRVAMRLRASLELVAVALAEGRISWDHARVLADLAVPRTVHIVHGFQEQFLSLAEILPFERWRAEVAGLVDLVDTDGGHRPAPTDGRLHLHDGLRGATELTGSLTSEQAATVKNALNLEADRLFRQFAADLERSPELEMPTRSQLLAHALVELCRKSQSVSASARGPVTDLTIIVSASDPLSPQFGGSEGGAAGDHVRLQDGTTRRLVCDPSIRAVVVDSLGNPIDLGRRARFASEALRQAINVRDGGCVFPGCTAPSNWCDLHHVVHWADGGATAPENLASLCRHHHGVSHRSGWSMSATGGQRFQWVTPGGQLLTSQRRE